MTKEHLYILSRYFYSIADPIISDQEYDALHQLMISQNLLSKYTSRTWSDDPVPVELLNKYEYFDRIIQKDIYGYGESLVSLRSEAVINGLIEKLPNGCVIFISPKIDGWNINATFINGKLIKLSPRSAETQEVLPLKELMVAKDQLFKNVPKTFTGKVFGEGHLSNESFNTLKEIAKSEGKMITSQRASVSTALKFYPHLCDILFFDIVEEGREFRDRSDKYGRIRELGLPTPPHKIAVKYNLIQMLKSCKKSDYPYMTDGQVISFIGTKEQSYACRIGDYSNNLYASIVIGVEESFGPTRCGLRLKINPIQLNDGSTQRYIDVDNLARLNEFNITKFSPIVFEKVSDVVEKIHPLTKELNTTNEEKWGELLEKHNQSFSKLFKI